MTEEMSFRCEIELQLGSEKFTEIAVNSLQVDKELRPEKVKKLYKANGKVLQIEVLATDSKALKVAVSSVCDYASVVIDTLRQFGEY